MRPWTRSSRPSTAGWQRIAPRALSKTGRDGLALTAIERLRAARAHGALVLAIADFLVLREARLLDLRVGHRVLAADRHGHDASLARLAAGRARGELVIGHALE